MRLAAPIQVVASLLLLASSAAFAVESNDVSEHNRPISATLLSVLDKWSHADAAAIASSYEPTGDFVSPGGVRAVGRVQIQAFYAAAFANGYAGSQATASIKHIRYITDSIALIDGLWGIEPTATAKITEPESGIFCAVLVKHGTRWQISALREQTSATHYSDLGERSK